MFTTTLRTASILNTISKTRSVSAAEISEAVDEKSANNDAVSDEEKGNDTDYNYEFPEVCTTTNASSVISL